MTPRQRSSPTNRRVTIPAVALLLIAYLLIHVLCARIVGPSVAFIALVPVVFSAVLLGTGPGATIAAAVLVFNLVLSWNNTTLGVGGWAMPPFVLAVAICLWLTHSWRQALDRHRHQHQLIEEQIACAEARESRYAQLLELLPGRLYVLSRDGQILRHPLAQQRNQGIPASIIGHNIAAILPDEAASKLRGTIRRALQGGSPLPVTIPFPSRGGMRETELVLIPFGEHEVVAVAVAVDSSTLDQSLSTDQSMYLLSELARNSQDVLWLANSDRSVVLYVSPAFERIWGVSPQQLRAQPKAWTDAIHPRDLKRVLAAYQATLPDGYDVEYRVIRGDGELRSVRERAFPSPPPEVGGLIGGIISDITGDVRAREALDQSEHRFRRLVDHAAEPVFVVDSFGQLLDVNQYACKTLGYSRSELLKRTVRDISPRFLSGDMAEIWRQLESGEPITAHAELLPRSGAAIPVELRVGPFGKDDEQHLLVLARDVTERQRVLQEYASMLAASAMFRDCPTEHSLYAQLPPLLATMLTFDEVTIEAYDAPRRKMRMLGCASNAEAGAEVSCDATLSGRAATSGALCVETAIHDSAREDLTLQRRRGLAAAVAVPLVTGEGIEGTLLCGTSEIRPFSPSLIETVRMLADGLAQAIAHKRVQQGLRLTRFVIDHASQVVLWVDQQGRITYANETLSRLLGWSEADNISINSVQPDMTPAKWQALWERLAGAEQANGESYESTFAGSAQQRLTVDVSANYLEFGGDALMCLMGRDISARKRAEQALRESEERYALASAAANDGLWDWNLPLDEIYFSPRWQVILGASSPLSRNPEEWFSRVHPDDIEKLRAALVDFLSGKDAIFHHEHRIRHGNGEYRWVLSRGLSVKNAENIAYRVVGSLTDITPRKLAEEQLVHDALHDGLTGLANRKLFEDRLAFACKRLARQPETLFAVMFLDLDHFKEVNDNLGHAGGDLLLVETARRISACVRPTDTVARMGGDEFVVLLDGLSDQSDALRVAQRLILDISDRVEMEGSELHTSVSIGIALSSSVPGPPAALLRAADTALYRAKHAGRNQYQLFDPHTQQLASSRLSLEAELQHGYENDQFRLLYQPVLRLSDQRVVAVEALLRWEHPERGLLPPEQFIEVLERTRLRRKVNRWVLREALSTMTRWRDQGQIADGVPVSVNVFGAQLSAGTLSEDLEIALSESTLAPAQLQLEFAERLFSTGMLATDPKLALLRKRGVRFCLDNFGSALAPLAALYGQPLDAVKLDRAVIRDVCRDAHARALVRAVITVCQELALPVIAVGVESAAQLECLQACRCDYAQGNLFAAPQTAETLSRTHFLLSPEHHLDQTIALPLK